MGDRGMKISVAIILHVSAVHWLSTSASTGTILVATITCITFESVLREVRATRRTLGIELPVGWEKKAETYAGENGSKN
jgi:hypothetical protein